nr:hypothetical protein [Tanacetum cinerariifolium]
MTTLAEHIIVAVAENRSPMLEKSILNNLFDKFVYVQGETLYEYYWGFSQLINDMHTIGMTMQQAQVNTKFLNALPPKWSKFITDAKLAKSLYTTNYDQLYAYVNQHERHANETIPQNSAFQTKDLDAYDSNCNDISSSKAVLMENLSSCDSDVLSEVPYSDTYLNDMINQDVQEISYSEQTHIVDILDNEITSDNIIIPHSQYLQDSQNVGIQDTNSSAPNDLLVLSLVEQMTDHVTNLDKENQTNKMVNESLTAELERYKERVVIFEQRLNQGEYPIDCINKAIAFLSIVASRANYAAGQANIVKCYNCLREGNMAKQCTQPNRPRSSAWFKEKLMLTEAQEADHILDEGQLAFISDIGIAEVQDSQNVGIQDTNSSAPNDLLVLSLVEQMIDHVTNLDKENQTNKMVNESLTAELERYKERVAIFEQRLNVKEKESLSTTLTIFKTECKEKESKYMEKKIVLENQNKEMENTLSLKNELRKLKGKNVIDTAVSKPSATIAPGMFKLDIEPVSHRLTNNRNAYDVYLEKTIENTDTLRGLIEWDRKQNPNEPLLESACMFTKHV